MEGYSGEYGPDTRLNNKSVVELFQEGSKKEDTHLCRAANHFHNPIVPDTWDNGKLTDTSGAVNWYCDNLSLPDDQNILYPSSEVTSNLTWGTGFISHDQKDSYILDKNIWDWESAREYYFTAVTGLSGVDNDYGFKLTFTENERNEYLEKTLITVGHVAHMLQDVAVPAHVHNDFARVWGRTKLTG